MQGCVTHGLESPGGQACSLHLPHSSTGSQSCALSLPQLRSGQSHHRWNCLAWSHAQHCMASGEARHLLGRALAVPFVKWIRLPGGYSGSGGRCRANKAVGPRSPVLQQEGRFLQQREPAGPAAPRVSGAARARLAE